jgi:dynein intermediate chain 2
MKHIVGGWPKELDYTETGDVGKYLKKLYRDPTLGFA